MIGTATRRTLLIFAPCFLLGARRQASTFVATVANAMTNEPVVDAEVTITDVSRSVRTNWLGEGAIDDVRSGKHHVRVRRVGYIAADVDVVFSRDTVGVFFSLSPNPQAMDTVRTLEKARRSLLMDQFENRRRLGIGKFITDSILQADSTHQLTNILEQHIPQLYSIDDGRRMAVRTAQQGRVDCSGFDTYIDGTRVSSSRGGDETDLRPLVGGDVAGVEFYTNFNAPVEYRHQSMACGVLLIWLRY
ncbi:MAG: hypothetical protein ACREPM_22130 [Gemmatimonadaceae bacterium]